jgi:hypothetical protein
MGEGSEESGPKGPDFGLPLQGDKLLLNRLNPKFESLNPKQIRNSNFQMTKTPLNYKKGLEHWDFGPLILSFDFAQDGELVEPFRISYFVLRICELPMPYARPLPPAPLILDS